MLLLGIPRPVSGDWAGKTGSWQVFTIRTARPQCFAECFPGTAFSPRFGAHPNSSAKGRARPPRYTSPSSEDSSAKGARRGHAAPSPQPPPPEGRGSIGAETPRQCRRTGAIPTSYPPPLGGGAGGGVSSGRLRRRPFRFCPTFAEESSEEGEVGERSEPGGGGASPIPIAGRASPQGESSGGPKRPHRPRCARPLPPLKRGKDILRRPCRFAEDSIRGRRGDRRSGSDGKDARGALGTHFGR